jgi:hypothetical protein
MSVPWLTLTLADLSVSKAAALVTALQSAALGAGQPDPLPEVIVNVTQRIRMEIAAGGKTRLSATTTTLPPSLKSLAVRMVLREGQSRLNAVGALPLSEDERQESRDDLRFLERIAKGEITVEEPDDPAATPTVQAATPSPLITARDRRFTRDDQDGI